MLAGEFFGEAIRIAREEIFNLYPDVSTWGAYQCYGEPSYRLSSQGINRQRPAASYTTPHELAVDLDNLSSDLRSGGHRDDFADRIESRLKRIPLAQSEAWLARADVAAALGFAWGEGGDMEKGAEQLRKAIRAERGLCSIRAIEQLANYEVRIAGTRWQANPDAPRSNGKRCVARCVVTSTRPSTGWPRLSTKPRPANACACSAAPTSAWP
jgi:hypothetical protein